MANVIAGIDTAALVSLLEKVHRDVGYDFREYKPGTVTRRLERRLQATGVGTYPEYMEFLDAHPEEYQRLADDLTIKVSDFFRSPYTFQQVAGLVLPELTSFKGDRGGRDLRFWSTSCARGEEPYSIAILLAEFWGDQRQSLSVSIHATDISRQALKEARVGIYSPREVRGLPPALLKRYFRCVDRGYAAKTGIREMVSFSYFDLTLAIPQPFVDVDCIFCCNVLIYLQSRLQEKVLGRLYDSLAAPGYLILGEAETPTSSLKGKLECLDSKARIYKKNERR